MASEREFRDDYSSVMGMDNEFSMMRRKEAKEWGRLWEMVALPVGVTLTRDYVNQIIYQGEIQ